VSARVVRPLTTGTNRGGGNAQLAVCRSERALRRTARRLERAELITDDQDNALPTASRSGRPTGK
jgi:hypothetical protein